MRAIVCTTFDSPSKLVVGVEPDPIPKPHEVLLRVEATGLGYVDALTVAGLYQIKPPLPFIPGNEVAGVVEQVGDEVKDLKVGARVLAMPSRGGLAERVALPAVACIPIPDVLGFDAAASFLVNYCTAHHGLFYCGNLQAGETVLVLGASGGVGVAAIDVAKATGAWVVAAASTEEKRKACLDLGADAVVDYTRAEWRDDLKSALAGRPLNVVYDPVGGGYSEPALRSLAPDGRFLVVGFAAGDIPRVPLNLLLLKRVSIVGVNWGGYVAGRPAVSRPVVDALMEMLRAGKLNPAAGETYPLDQAGSAMMKMLERKAIGKTVIRNQV